MDMNNWSTAASVGEAATVVADWRVTLQADSRQRMVNKIMETVMRHLPFSGEEGLQELKKIVLRFEEKIYTAATSQTDYLRKISLKMLTMESKSQPLNSAASPSMQSKVSIPLLANQPQARQQLLPQNMQNNMNSGGLQSSATLQTSLPPVSGLNQTQIYVAGQNTSLQNPVATSIGQGVLLNMFGNPDNQMLGRYPVIGQQQQRLQSSQQYAYQQQQQFQQQLLMKQRNLAHPMIQSQLQQQQQPQQNALQSSQFQQPQQNALQSASMSSLSQNQSSSVQQSTQSMLRQQQFQQQAVGLHQQPSSMMQQQLLSTQQQSQVLPTQQQQQQQQPMHSQQQLASLDSTAQTGQTNGVDWQEETYQKIKAMKEMYLPELNELIQKISTTLQQHDSLSQQLKSDQLENLKMFKTMLERTINFLQVPKENVMPSFKDKLGSYEKQIMSFLTTHRPEMPMPQMQQGQLPLSQMNPQLQPMTMQRSVSSMQQNNISNMQQSMMNSLQPGSNISSGLGNAMTSSQGVTMGSIQQNSQSGLTMLQQSQHLQSNLQRQQQQQQRAGYLPQQMKSGVSFPISPQLLQTYLSQPPQLSTLKVDQQNLLPSLPKTGSPPLSTPLLAEFSVPEKSAVSGKSAVTDHSAVLVPMADIAAEDFDADSVLEELRHIRQKLLLMEKRFSLVLGTLLGIVLGSVFAILYGSLF